MSAHTPGPWQQGPTKTTVSMSGYDVHAIPISGNGSAIGCVYAGAVGRPRNVDVEYANARLIAAAPELLAALRRATEFLAINYSDAVPATLLHCRAALAKAQS